ncbi:MAG TPA: hypothetical protein VFO77_11655 [Actinoplanes sp.]|nr:hypothetical protein [Actinoplanes sp.]
MRLIDRLRTRRRISRQAQAIERALRDAPSRAMREEILIFAQRHTD